jgi:chromosome partitioning protein
MDLRGRQGAVGCVALTIACANQKGGVGKTTTVVNLAASLALGGDRVLIVDLDPQGNATSGLGLERDQLERTVYDALINEGALSEIIYEVPIPGLQLVPSSISLAGAELELVPLPLRERRLSAALGGVTASYDLVLVDCPPSLGLLTVNALTAADGVLIPVQCEYYALEGLTQLIGTIHLVRDHLNPALELEGALLTMADARTNLSSEVESEVRRHLGPAVYETVIPRSVRLSEAPSHGLPIALYSPDSKGAAAYARFAAEFRARLVASGRLGDHPGKAARGAWSTPRAEEATSPIPEPPADSAGTAAKLAGLRT